MLKKVTLVVCVYDTEKYLSRCLDSIVNQTFGDLEILVVNDGSPDGSLGILREYEQNDPRITVYDTPNRGVAGARNLGLQQAHGDYIIFIDSDDYLNPDMIEKLYGEITLSESELAVCNIRRVYNDHAEGPFFKMPQHLFLSTGENSLSLAHDILTDKLELGGSVSNKLYKTSFLRQHNLLFEDRSHIYAEDAFLFFQSMKYVRQISILGEPLYNYYMRDNSVSRSYKPHMLPRCIRFIEQLRKYYNDPRLDGAFTARTYLFFIELLYNETDFHKGYSSFRKIVTHDYFRKKLIGLKLADFSMNQKIIYYLYRCRLTIAIYFLFKIRNGGT